MTLKIFGKDEDQDQFRLITSIFSICVICGIALFEAFAQSFPPTDGQFPLVPFALALLCSTILGKSVYSLIEVRSKLFRDEVERVRFLVRHDGLTGALNRTSFIDEMRASCADGQLLIIDADHFKAINDGHGHYTGDKALMQLTRSVQMVVGSSGLTGRLGGEEFGVFLPKADEAKAIAMAELIRRTIERDGFQANGVMMKLTVSIGICDHRAADPVGLAFKRADKRLYAAKSLGRNRVVAHDALHDQMRGQIEDGLKRAPAVTAQAA